MICCLFEGPLVLSTKLLFLGQNLCAMQVLAFVACEHIGPVGELDESLLQVFDIEADVLTPVQHAETGRILGDIRGDERNDKLSWRVTPAAVITARPRPVAGLEWQDCRVPKWDDAESFGGLAVWSDKTVVLGGLAALGGQVFSPTGLLDAIALVDALVWFDSVVVDASIDVEWPPSVAGAFVRRALDAEERQALHGALVDTWNSAHVSPVCEAYWQQVLGDDTLRIRLSDADLVVDSAATVSDYLAEQFDLLNPTAMADRRWLAGLAAFNTARSFSGGLIAAQLRLFHMATAVRRGLLARFATPGQATDLITIEPAGDARFPSAFGRVVGVAQERGVDCWDAIAAVRNEMAPVRTDLQGTLADPSRIRPRLARHQLGFGRPEWQVGLGAGVSVVSASVARNLRPRTVALVTRLESAAVTLQEAADDICRLVGLDRPVSDPVLAQLGVIARRLAVQT